MVSTAEVGAVAADDWRGPTLDWPAIEAEERRAVAKAETLPRCSICTSPMWLAQPGRHHTCARRLAERTPEGDHP